ncbi:MAG: TIGR03790 family protein, partial [Chthoniobacterales bacterium]
MRSAALAALIFVSCVGVARAEPSLADATIVVFNSDVPESIELARFYAEKRGIARDHLVALRCSTEEEISREDYDRTLAGPLRVIFKKKKWWSENPPEKKGGLPTVTSISIRFVALIKGMPLKIKPAEKYPGDKPQPGPLGSRNEASVDSELAVLSRFQPIISGAVSNPYYKSFRRILESPPLPILLVCRLDAPTAATVKKMIEDSIATEKTGLWGRAYVDAARKTEPGYEVGDEWMKEIVEQVRRAGIPVVYDRE